MYIPRVLFRNARASLDFSFSRRPPLAPSAPFNIYPKRTGLLSARAGLSTSHGDKRNVRGCAETRSCPLLQCVSYLPSQSAVSRSFVRPFRLPLERIGYSHGRPGFSSSCHFSIKRVLIFEPNASTCLPYVAVSPGSNHSTTPMDGLRKVVRMGFSFSLSL